MSNPPKSSPVPAKHTSKERFLKYHNWFCYASICGIDCASARQKRTKWYNMLYVPFKGCENVKTYVYKNFGATTETIEQVQAIFYENCLRRGNLSFSEESAAEAREILRSHVDAKKQAPQNEEGPCLKKRNPKTQPSKGGCTFLDKDSVNIEHEEEFDNHQSDLQSFSDSLASQHASYSKVIDGEVLFVRHSQISTRSEEHTSELQSQSN